jgi:cysteinyl-tRNA synthetase
MSSMSLKIYNTLSRKKEEFIPMKKNRVHMFVCGITPYDSPHIGNLRSFLNYDLIARYLRFLGYDLFYLQNITDIDDKIIKRAKEKDITFKKLSNEYFKELKEILKKLNINSVDKYAKATAHIPDIIKQIQTLLKKGYAYQNDGTVFFDVTKFKDYGKLSGQNLKKLQRAERNIEEDENKKHPYDFALWKAKKIGEPFWRSPFGPGRPGWHIEDTAITEHYFGKQYDIHGGGMDLIFPHHECEIAQQEAASGKKPFVRYWMHSGFINVNGEKMSKSLGNFVTAKEITEKFNPETIRFALLSIHYRSPADFSENMLMQAKNTVQKISDFSYRLKYAKTKDLKEDKKIKKFVEKFFLEMNNDFNTPQALASLFELIKYSNYLMDKNLLSKPDKKDISLFFKNFEKIFGIKIDSNTKTKTTKDIEKLLKSRENFRKNKQWQEADKIRDMLLTRGYVIEDTPEGQKIKFINKKEN